MYNATKFNQYGGLIRVTQDYDKQSQMLSTIVYDKGFGMSDIKLKRFSSQSHEESVDVTSGLGIGLSNSKFLAEGSGGSISLISMLGEFTKVTFTVKAPEIRMN